MAGAAVRESATFEGRPDQVREARSFVGGLLGPSHPCGDVAVLLASEVVTNSLLHGGSAGPGETVTVTVVVSDSGVRVEVTGRKADSVPVLRRSDDEAEGSRGLRLVEELAVRWGYERGGGQATTWFELWALFAADATFRSATGPATSPIGPAPRPRGIPHDPDKCSPPVLR
jgi:anti-sigma regulatory factor (Ser/Thr protein kinase)